MKLLNVVKRSKMEVSILFVILFGIGHNGFSQVKLYREHGVEIMGTPESFLAKNEFEYAIVAYAPSDRSFGRKTFTCLVKQQDVWYLFKISGAITTSSPVPALQVRPVIVQKKLSSSEADSLIKLVCPNEGMKYSQEQLNTLPKWCLAEYRGRKGLSGDISDAATYHLAERSDGNITSLYFYAASTYLEKCLPLNPEFGMLKGMVNTVQTLDF